MAELEELLIDEVVLRERIYKLIENGKKTPHARRTQGFYEIKISDLKDAWKEYIELDSSIRKELKKKSSNIATKYVDDDHFGNVELKYSEYMGELLEGIRALNGHILVNNDEQGTVNNATIIHQESSLPKICIPKYNGDYDLWTSFHDLFVSLIHTNSRLSPVQKLHHLKSCLTGDAEKLLRHVPITNNDYEPAWSKLKARYENKRIIVNHQLKILINQPKLQVEKLSGVKSLIDTTEECLQQLKSLDVDTSKWDVLLIHLLVQKFPYATLRLWEEEQGVKPELPTYKEFSEFLTKRLKILEAISDAVTVNSPTDKIQRGSTLSHHNLTPNVCPVCKENHFLTRCDRYQSMEVDERKAFITKEGRCLNCLSKNHFVKQCNNKFRCFKCKQKHHTTLHEDNNAPVVLASLKANENQSKKQDTKRLKEKQSNQNTSIYNEEQNQTQAFMSRNRHLALLSTALVVAQSEHGNPITLRCLIDTGSQSSFITKEACKLIQAKCIKTSTAIMGLNTSPATVAQEKTTLKLRARTNNKTTLEEEFLIIEKITDPLPTRRITKNDCKHLQGLTLADPTFWKPGKIDALLGVGLYAKIIQDGIRRGLDTAPVAMNTTFGWILLGATNNENNNGISSFTLTTQDQKLDQQLKQFWDIEEIPAKKSFTKEEEDCQRFYVNTLKRLESGKYQVQLPFKEMQPPELGRSRNQALVRYFHLQKQFIAKPELQKEYTKCINEYLELGHMEPIKTPNDEDKEEHYYLPHHAVFKESTTTKLRVVFDASAKTTNGTSLNEHMLKGPTLQPKLFATLLKWRKYRIAMNADIEKMYRMIQVHPKHQTYQRIIWHHPATGKITDYAIKTVTFGTTSAPYLAIRTLKQLSEDEKEKCPIAAKILNEDFYVDDVLTGADNVDDAKIVQEQLINILKSGGFNLRKWTSNEPQLIRHLPKEYQESRSELIFSENQSVKTLGIRWHPASDNFSFIIKSFAKQSINTKRSILSEVASLYDPLGWLAPIVIKAKILMQDLWITGCAWDSPVSDHIQEQWNKYNIELSELQQIKIPRWVSYSPQIQVQLHGFCDASEKAYAAVIYLRTTTNTGITSCQLLTAKTKVAPTKPTTIPRLELNGAVLLARLMKTTIEDMHLGNIDMYAWTDSTIALQWIKGHPSKWKTYVANRVVEVQEIIRFEQWHHVPTNTNPADLASRGVNSSQLVNNDLWWQGPNWLLKNESSWPKLQKIKEQTTLEMKIPKLMTITALCDDDIFMKYSTFSKLVRVIATIKRFTSNCKNTSNRLTSPLSVKELNDAEITILRTIQQKIFAQEYECLSNQKNITRSSRIIKLNPFIDSNKLLLLGGRLDNAMIPYNRKYPIILPPDHHVIMTLIDKVHKETLHGGTALVLNVCREKYWILNARRCISTKIHKCLVCARQRAVLSTQLMGGLPVPRVNITKPFTNVGIDFAGPIVIKSSKLRNAKTLKAYFCILVCMSTKAIHLEVVSDLTSAAFIAALKRFVARRGLCTNIYSDCGTNFVGGNNVLQQELKQALKQQHTEFILYLTNRGINWDFNPPASPHFGGLWEAGVKSVKHHLKRVVGTSICTYEEYATILTQIEACVNSRPLCYINNNPEELFVLTPGHFLIGSTFNAVPEPEYQPNNVLPSARWKYVQLITQQFWKIWSKEYLHQLQHRPKWSITQSNIKVGDMVLVKNENMPPTMWPLGVVKTVFPGQDGLVRVVEVKTTHGSIQRSVTKICRLPIENEMVA